MSLRWSSYVAEKPPKGAQKRKTADFRIKSHLKKLCYKVSFLHQTADTKPLSISACKQRAFGIRINEPKKRSYHLSREINDTDDAQTEANNLYGSIIIAKTVWNATLEFLRYEIERKIGVILRCKLATHNEQMSKLPYASLFQIF